MSVLAACLLAAAQVTDASSVWAQSAIEARPASALPSLAYYQLDGEAQWQLADHAVTQEGRTPTQPAAVYLQFGSVSCEPCHELAAWIAPRLPVDAVAVYGHVDEVELVENGAPLGRMLRQLREQLDSIAAYARFLTVTNVPSEVVRELTGGAGLPGGLFILSDGRHVTFTGFTPDELEPLLAWWLAEAGGTP
jgi:hypothetical protein